METLVELGTKNEAQKLYKGYIPLVGHYCEKVYPVYFEPIRNKKLNLLEIGVAGGGSLRMWRDYFPYAKVYGIDRRPICQVEGENRIKTFLGEQQDVKFLEKVVNEIGDIDILIDDGSHMPAHQTITFEFIFPKLKPGSLYIIEDLMVSYWPTRDGGVKKPGTIMEYLKDVCDKVIDQEHTQNVMSFTGAIEYMHFYKGMVVIKKGLE